MKATLILLILFAFGYLSSAQIIINSSCEDQVLCVDEDNCGPLSQNLNIDASTSCSTGSLSFSYSLDFDDNGTIDFSGDNNSLSTNLPIGIHRITFNVSDDCGESETCSYFLEVKDCTAPEIESPNGFVVTLTGAGDLTLDATSLNTGSSDNCSVAQFLIHSPSLGSGQTIPPTEAANSWTYGCEDLGAQTLDLWVGDAHGNWSYYSTYIVIQDDFQTCTPDTEIEICVWARTECGELIDSVYTGFLLDIPGIPNINDSLVLANDCDSIAPLGFLTLEPQKVINPKNGVSTLDMLLIAKHILGIVDLPGPYRQLAADVNFSGNITTYDIVIIRQLLLDFIDEFPGHRSWRFVVDDFVFPNVDNPFATAIPSALNINGLSGDASVEFIGIKIGDVNKSADPSELAPQENEDRNTSFIHILDQSFEVGEKVQVDFTLDDLQQLSGLQFALEFDPEVLSYVKSTSGILSDFGSEHLGLSAIEKGILKASWINMNGEATTVSDEVLFSLFFDAKRAGKLSEVLRLQQTGLRAEAYDQELNTSNLALDFSTVLASEEISTKIIPNPVGEVATLWIDVPVATQGTLAIIAGDGRRIKNIPIDLTAGRNAIPLDFDKKTNSGIFIYQLNTKDGMSASGKIIKL